MLSFRFWLAIMIFSLMAFAADAASLTCTNQKGGTWTFGTAPSVCDVSPLMSTQEIKLQYGPVLFQDKDAPATARKSFLSQLYPVVREAGIYYLLRRNPGVTPAEMNGFLDALFALAHQESLWSHYRDGGDGIIRYMRGDQLHGHGLMQVDDRSHTEALKNGRGVDLIYNIIYGLDIFYANWVKSASAACVSAPTDFRARARSAWAAYNGGPGSICRWQNTKSPYASHDQEYLSKFTQRSWLAYIANTKAPSALNVKCLAEGTRPCAPTGSPIKKILAPDFAPPTERNLASQALPLVELKIDRPYQFLRVCPDEACAKTTSALHGEGASARGELIEKNQRGWFKIQHDRAQGWVPEDSVWELK